MVHPPPPPYRPPPPPPALIPTRSTSLPKSKRSNKTSIMSTVTTLTPTRKRSISSPRPRSPSPKKHPFSAPPTWRAKFPTLRRSNLKLSSTTSTAERNNPYKRWSAASSASNNSTHSISSSISLTSSTVEYGKAEVVEVVRAPKPKIVDAQSPMMTRKPTGQNKKLLEYYGVRQTAREVVAKQRASNGGGRVSAFREEFESPQSVRSDVTAIRRGGERALPKLPMEHSEKREGREVSEGLMKWFRCDIFPSNEADFQAAESEAKDLVVEGGGTVMSAWTYPGGFMFQIPRSLPSPLPPSIPSATPTPASTILAIFLGETGSLRVTEFQPHLDPMQHLLQQASPRSSCASTLAGDEADPADEKQELISAIEYLTTTAPPPSPNSSSKSTPKATSHPSPLRSHPPSPLASVSVEEIPLLRTSPSKSSPAAPRSNRRSWSDSKPVSPETKGRLTTWILKQQNSDDTKVSASNRRKGVVYGGPGSRGLSGLKIIEEVMEEDVIGREDAAEWVSDDEDEEGYSGGDEGSEAGSEFSIVTGLDSVRFVAECGSLF